LEKKKRGAVLMECFEKWGGSCAVGGGLQSGSLKTAAVQTTGSGDNTNEKQKAVN
jgi:hypothetical protein